MPEGSFLIWAGEKFAGGIVGGAGGAVFSEIMSLVLPQDPNAPVLAKLDQITSSLDSLNQSVTGIVQSVAALHHELSVKTEEIKAEITEAQYKPAVNRLNSYYGTLADGVSDNPESLLGLVLSAKQGSQAEAAAELKGNIDGKPGSPGAHADMTDLKDCLIASAFATDKPLIGKWTDLLIEKMRSSASEGEKLFKYYLVLEAYFMQVVATQFKGGALLAASFGQGAPMQAGPERDQALAQALRKARGHLQALLQPECVAFVESVERLVLSQFEMCAAHPASRAAKIYDDSAKALLRADVLAAALNNQMKGLSLRDACSGTFARYFCKPGVAIDYDATAKTLRINGRPPMTGVQMSRPTSDTGAHLIVWKDEIPTVAPIDSSKIEIIRVRTDARKEHMWSVWAQRCLDAGRDSSGKPIQSHYKEFWDEYDVATLKPAVFPFPATTASVASFTNIDHAVRALFPGRTTGGYTSSHQGGGSALWIPYSAEYKLREASILSPVMGFLDYSGLVQQPYDKRYLLQWRAATRPGISVNIDWLRVPDQPAPSDHMEQMTTALLFRAAASNENIMLRVYGSLDMGPYERSSPLDMDMGPFGPPWSGGGYLTHTVEFFLIGTDGSSSSIFKASIQATSSTPPQRVQKFIEASGTLRTVGGVDYSLRMVHTTDCSGVANDNRLFVALSLSGVGIVRPPQEIIL